MEAETALTQQIIEHLWPEVRKLSDDQISNLMDGIHRMENSFRQAKFEEIREISRDRPEVQKYLRIYSDTIE